MMRKFLWILAAAAALQLCACGSAAGTVADIAEGLGISRSIGEIKEKADAAKEKAESVSDIVSGLTGGLVPSGKKGKEAAGKKEKAGKAAETGKPEKQKESTAAEEAVDAERSPVDRLKEMARVEVEEQVVFDEDGVRIKVNGFDVFNDKDFFVIRFTVTNIEDEVRYYDLGNVRVNGILMPALGGMRAVGPGATIDGDEAGVYILGSEFRAAGIRAVGDVSMSCWISDKDYRTLSTGSFAFRTAAAGSEEAESPVPDGEVLYDRDGFTIKYLGSEDEDTDPGEWFKSVYLFLENTGEEECSLNLSNDFVPSVDGVEGEYDYFSILGSELKNGDRMLYPVEFSSKHFENVDPEKIRSLDLTCEIRRRDGSVETLPVHITLENGTSHASAGEVRNAGAGLEETDPEDAGLEETDRGIPEDDEPEEDDTPADAKIPEITDRFFTSRQTVSGSWEGTVGYLIKNNNPDAAFAYVPMRIELYAEDGTQLADVYRGHGGIVLPGETVPVFYRYYVKDKPVRDELVLQEKNIMEHVLGKKKYSTWVSVTDASHLSDRVSVGSYELVEPENGRFGLSDYRLRGTLKNDEGASGYGIVCAVFTDAGGHCVYMAEGNVGDLAADTGFDFTLNTTELPEYDHIDFYVYEGVV